MEDVLDVYQRPYDPKQPVVCFDETSKELHDTPRGSIEPSAGQSKRIDYEYQRNGTASIFLWVEPLGGRRNTYISDTRTALDCARALKRVVDEDYPDADKVVLVLDNLNTHNPAALYKCFEPAEAHRIVNKIEWHYTPEHGSWLNIAEIEFSVLSKQCLNRRIADKATLQSEISAWLEKRNSANATINWQFRTADARIKLKRLYPEIILN